MENCEYFLYFSIQKGCFACTLPEVAMVIIVLNYLHIIYHPLFYELYKYIVAEEFN